jgi:hypothetical protein
MVASEDIDSIFMPCLTEVARLMKEQLARAGDRNLTVKVGGPNAELQHSVILLEWLTSLPESHPHWRLRSVPITFEISGEYTCSDL